MVRALALILAVVALPAAAGPGGQPHRRVKAQRVKIACPSNYAASISNADSVAVTYSTPATSSGGAAPVAIVYSPTSGSNFAAGTTRVTATATDAKGVTAACNFDVAVSPYLFAFTFPAANACYASPWTPAGAPGAITVTRTTAASTPDGTSCASGQARGGPSGIVVQPTRTNYIPAPTAPVTGNTAAIAATGAHLLWIEGTGSVTVAQGTATFTAGNGCVATSSAPCAITASVVGTPSITVSGTVSFAQLENGATKTAKILTQIARSSDLYVSSPTTTFQKFCMRAKYTPWNGWGSDFTGSPVLAMLSGTLSSDSAAIRHTGNTAADFIVFNGAANKEMNANWSGLADPNTSHQVVGCADGAGGVAVYFDGLRYPAQETTSGAGTGIRAATAMDFRIGARATGSMVVNGSEQDVGWCGGSSDPAACGMVTGAPLVAAVGDSITLGSNCGTASYPKRIQTWNLWGSHADANYRRAHRVDNFAVGGKTCSQVYTDQWTASVKGKGYAQVFMLCGYNDIGRDGATGAATWATLKTMIDEAYAEGLDVVVGTPTPAGSPANTQWTAGKTTEMAAFRASIQGYNPGPRYHVADFYNSPLNDGSGQLAFNTGSADGVHPDQNGCDAMAVVAQPLHLY